MSQAESYYRNEAFEILQKAYQTQTEGKVDEAVGLYKKSIELCPTAEAYTYLGWAYSNRGRYDDAIQECYKAIAVDPDFGNPYNDIGAYLIEKGKHDEAVPWLEKAIKAKRYDSYCYPHYNLGRIWESKGSWFKAIQCYEVALKENSDYRLAERSIRRLRGLLN